MKTFRFSFLLLLLGVLALPAQAQQHLTLEDIHASAKFNGESFRGGRWAQDGPVVVYVERDPQTGASNLMSYNLETDARTRLLDGSLLTAGDVDRTIEIEDYAYSTDGGTVLIYTDSEPVWRLNTKGYYYLFDVEAKTLRPLADRSKGFQMFAKLSPDGKRAGFVRDRNLFVVDLSTMRETQLTTEGKGAIIFGTSDWVYEEEFGLRDGWQWSPDSRHIAFVQFDESATRDFAMTDLRGLYPEYVRFRYPKAGEANSEIRVGVADVATGALRYFDTDTWHSGGDEHEYIPLFGWTPEMDGGSRVWIFRMNRDQNDLDVLYGDPQTMEVQRVLNERSDAWLDVETGFSDLDVGALTYLRDGEHFIWVSERDGYRHLYLYKNDGTPVRRLTSGEWDITNFLGADEENGLIYFVSTQESPLERHLYRQRVSLTDADLPASAPEKITQEPGWHSINLSRDRRYYIDSYSTITHPTVVSLHRVDGSLVKVLTSNEALIERLAQYDLPTPEFTHVPAADGTELNAMVIKPTDFDASREYPVLMYVYGGPGSQTVQNRWGGSRHLWHLYLADALDMIVVSVDNRGTGGRGQAFRSATYRNLGQLEAADQISAAKYLGTLPYVDASRIGIWGWSYGGYMTLMAMLSDGGPQTFKAGIAVAPVTDWRLYDTIYTERYMSTPQHNALGYDLGAPVKMAANLSDNQELLIIHGDFDDNVHFQNAVQMADALQAAGKQFEMMMYPGRNHGIFGGRTRLHLHTLMTNFLRDNLVGRPVTAGR